MGQERGIQIWGGERRQMEAQRYRGDRTKHRSLRANEDRAGVGAGDGGDLAP